MSKAIKDLVLAAAVIALGTARLWAQPVSNAAPAEVVPATNAVGARIQFETLLHDFGKAKAGEPVKYTYNFTNTGDETLVIKNVQPQCGCTAAGEWTKEVAPGKSGKIPIQFNSTGYNGAVFKQVTVTCNVSNQPIVILQLKGTVFKLIDVNPQFVAMTVPADATSASATVTITNNGDEPVEISMPESNNKGLKPTLITDAPGKGYHLLLNTTDPLMPGSAQAVINMKTSLTNMPVLSVQVYVNVQQAIVPMPQHISVQPAPLPGTITNSITIQNNSTNALTLSEPSVNFPGVGVEIKEMQPGRIYSALVAFPQSFEIPPGQQLELTIKTSNPKVPLVKVPITQIPRAARPPVPPAPPAAPAASGAPPSASLIKTVAPPPLPPGQ